jgi:hypothetical protein
MEKVHRGDGGEVVGSEFVQFAIQKTDQGEPLLFVSQPNIVVAVAVQGLRDSVAKLFDPQTVGDFAV